MRAMKDFLTPVRLGRSCLPCEKCWMFAKIRLGLTQFYSMVMEEARWGAVSPASPEPIPTIRAESPRFGSKTVEHSCYLPRGVQNDARDCGEACWRIVLTTSGVATR